MKVIDSIQACVKILNDLDEYNSTLPAQLSSLDCKQQDLLHYIEKNKINVLWCYKMVKELKVIREKRRKVKNDMELLSKFNELKNKMLSKDHREFLLSELENKKNQLDSEYKNREYSDEDIQNILTERG